MLWALALSLVMAPLPSAAEEGESREQITVTGTRIGRSNLEEYGPIRVITADQLQMTESTTLEDLLRDLPSVSLDGINKNNNNGGLGLSFVSLRDLGVQRTLVLVNGRRFVVGSSGVAEAVDLNNIPVPMVERIEILLDGASAVYGSDAVGGVINIILKDDFEGLLLDGFGGVSDEGDGETLNLSATMGANFDRGNITFNVSYLNRDKIRQSNRDWARKPVVFEIDAANRFIASSSTPFGRALAPDGSGLVSFTPDAATGLSYTPFASFPDELDVAPNGPRFNYGAEQWLTGSVERIAFTLAGHYDITDHVKFFSEAMFTRYDGTQRLAPQPLFGLVIPIGNPFIPADYKSALLAADPTASIVPAYARRMSNVGNRTTSVNSNTFRTVVGFEGDLGMFEPLADSLIGDYKWNLYVDWGKSRASNSMENAINLRKAEVAADPTKCAAEADFGCVVADYFGDGSPGNGGVSAAVAKYIRFTDTEDRGFDELVVGFDISGEVVELPAGPLGFAVGYEHRDEEGFNRPNAVNIALESAGNGQEPTAGGYKVDEIFGEVSIPILADLPGVDELTVDFAARYTKYDTFGSDDNYRVGLSYKPIDFLRLRGIYNTVFRAPSISDLFGGSAESFEALTDPCNNWDTVSSPGQAIYDNCQAAGIPVGYNQNTFGGSQFSTNIGGNPVLDAETAKIWNLGLVFTPTFLEEYIGEFSVTVDYYNIEVDQAIDSPDPQFILDDCYGSSSFPGANCSRVTRDIDPGEPAGGVGLVSNISAIAENLNKLELQGVDFTINWGFDLDTFGLPGIGRLDLGVNASRIIENSTIGVGGRQKDVGTIGNSGGTLAKWRVTSRGTFSRDDWSVTNTVRYIGGADIDTNSLILTKIDPTVYWDLAARYTWNSWTFVAGMDNVLDEDPPFIPEGGQNANTETYDFVGRFLWTRISYKF